MVRTANSIDSMVQHLPCRLVSIQRDLVVECVCGSGASLDTGDGSRSIARETDEIEVADDCDAGDPLTKSVLSQVCSRKAVT